MSRSGSLLDYCGPATRIPVEKGLALDPRRWGWMPKHDGSAVRIATDAAGRISTMLFRSGKVLNAVEADGLLGLATGAPDSVFWAEMTIYSEAAIREREALGYSLARVWDVSRLDGRSVAHEPFAVRHGLLQRWQATVENLAPEVARRQTWTQDAAGRAHDAQDGRFTRPRPRDLRLLPLVPVTRTRAGAESLWQSFVEVGGGEGLVAVDLTKPIGVGRRAKFKLKRTDAIACTVLEVGTTGARVTWAGQTFRIPCRAWVDRLRPGDVVDVVSDGFLECRPVPRFARVVRVRHDLKR